jgi:hypothetical protein
LGKSNKQTGSFQTLVSNLITKEKNVRIKKKYKELNDSIKINAGRKTINKEELIKLKI